MWTGEFWYATLERAIKTFAQALVGLLVADTSDVLNTDWTAMFSVAGMAAVVSVLTSIASGTVGEEASPSLASERLAEVRDYEDPDDDPDAPPPDGFLADEQNEASEEQREQ